MITIMDRALSTPRLNDDSGEVKRLALYRSLVCLREADAARLQDSPPVRITTPHILRPAADNLEDIVLPTVDRIAETVRKSLAS